MSVSLSLFAGAGWQFLDNNGNPLSGGLLYTYIAGTTTPQASYTTSSGSTPHSNPIVLDSAGRVPAGGEVWLTVGQTYKFVLQTAAAVLVGTYDNIPGGISSDSVTFLQSGTGAVTRTAQDKMREWVSVLDFGAVEGGDVGAAVNSALAVGHTMIRAEGSYTLSTQILLTGLNRVILDFRDASITASNALNVSLIRLINCTRCEVWGGFLDGNAAGQSSSSFGIDLNGGSYNKLLGGRVTNCKTYGVYIINCQYALIEGVEADNCQQSGIAGDVGPSSCVGVRIKNVVVHDNGLGGVGATSGLYLEGTPGTSHWFSEIVIDGVIAYGNRGSGVAGQGWQFYSLRNVKANGNYQQGIALFACLYGTGGDFTLNNNDVGGLPGYGNGVSIDDTGVTPPSQYNTFSNIFSANHGGFAVLERGTANNNSFIGVDSVSDGAVFSFSGASTIGLRRNVIQGNAGFTGQFVGNSVSSGVGYGTGAGGSVTQATSKSTGVTLNAPTGRITMNNAALGSGALVEFVLTNSAISSTDHLVFNVVSGATQAAYIINARPANGQATIEVRNNTAGSLSEAIVIGFVIIKGSVS